MKKLLLILFSGSLAFPAYCASGLRALSDWTPKGWKVIKEVTGDLNGDNIKDVVVIYEEDNPHNKKKNEGLGSNVINTNPRTIVVLLGENGLYRKLAENTGFIPPEGDEDNPCLADPLSDIKIQNNMLKVTLSEWLSCGSWSVTRNTYTFRFDGKGMQLIGRDESSFMRNSGEKNETSTNFLTGKRKSTTGLNEFGKSKPQTRWDSIKKEPLKYLENL